ncbi:Phage protein q [Yersinia rohdei ATCC 43380]|nr:Phage protein q [Yersinia rohdei ATCC 43380]
MKRAGVAGIALRASLYLIIRIDGVSALRTKTLAAFSTSPTDPTFSGLPLIS